MARTKKGHSTAGAPAGAPLTPDEARELLAGCDRSLGGHGLRPPAEVLDELATLKAGELATDTYGEGGTVAILEAEVKKLLKKPAAVFMPSGTMIQQAALRI